MPVAVIMPKFEMAQETGKVASWLVAEGSAVRKGDAILEVETDKVNQEVESPADGTLLGISAQAGQVVPIGQPIAYIVKAGEAWTPPGAGPAQPSAAAPAAPPEPTGRGDPAPIPAAASPLALRMAQELNIDLSRVAGTGPRGQVTREDVEAYVRVQASASGGAVRAVPAARRVARELGVDLALVRGTGPEGRIQSEDVRAHAALVGHPRPGVAPAGVASPGVTLTTAAPAAVAPAGVAEAAFAGQPAVRRMVPLTNIRKTIAERMLASVREAPQFTVAVEADMTRALAIVEDLKAGAAKDGPKITLTALLIKACAWALQRHPEANAAFIDGQIAEWDEVNIGVATAIDAGLIVPVVLRAGGLGMREIAAALADLSGRAREGKLKLEELQGGTFTISNLGMFGIDQFTAILNPPQAAILAVGRVAKRAVVDENGGLVVRPALTLTLTADHRVLDGASAARFLQTIQRVLEHPGLLME
jgi:pyruvate dehydrogenase E2 component (dihydrolipoamide acetyltransferase)